MNKAFFIKKIMLQFSQSTFEGATFFIGGANSAYIPRDGHGAIQKVFPNSTVTYIPKAGHNVQVVMYLSLL